MGCTGWRRPAASVEHIWDTCSMTVQDPQENVTALTQLHWLFSTKTTAVPPPPSLRVKQPVALRMMERLNPERKQHRPIIKSLVLCALDV
uniref:Methionine sulfoxide reductase B3 n=1 Tax=Nothobranchius korthausae TaxID=1143690 RepID=A0A1A8HFV8_9TELE